MGTMTSQITSLTIAYSTVIQAQIKENINAARHWPWCGESTGTGEFPAQMASNAENVSIWWRHHAVDYRILNLLWHKPHVSTSVIPLINSSPPGQNGHNFADDIFRCVLLNENVWISITFPLNSVPKGSINNIPALVQIMAWRRIDDKPFSEPMLTRFTDAYMRR